MQKRNLPLKTSYHHTIKKGFDWRLAFFILLATGIAFALGFAYGGIKAAELCIDLGLKVLEGVGVEIPIERDYFRDTLVSNFEVLKKYLR